MGTMNLNKPKKHIFLILVVLFSLFLSGLCSANGTETLISTGTFNSNQINPSVWGNWIVWEDQRNDDGLSGFSDIYAYNIASGEERRLTPDGSYCYDPSVYADKAIWYMIDASDGSYHIVYYNFNTDSQQDLYSTLNTISSVSFSSGNAVWEENDGQSDIMMFNISDSRLYSLTIDELTGADQQAPAVFGDIVVWEDYRNDPPDGSDIFMNNTATLTGGAITENLTDQKNPAISGKTVVWSDDQTGNTDIFSYDIVSQKITDITPYINNQLNPAIYDDQVIWLDNRFRALGSEFDLIKKDLTTGTETTALNSETALVSPSYKPSIFDNRIVWVDDRAGSAGGLSDIYLDTDGVSVTCPVASFTPLSPSGSLPLTVQFSDTSSGSPTHWHWNFGDGATSSAQNPSHTYASAGTFLANLSVGTSECRNMSIDHTVSAGIPTASFIASPIEGIAPQNIVFDRNATSGTVDSWSWDFGDTATSTDPDPGHIYTDDGTFDASLTATNTFGSDTRTRDDYITIKNGIRTTSTTTITGLTLATVGGIQQLTVDSTNFGTNYTLPDSWTLATKPAPSYGWQNITFLSADNPGFSNIPPVITGNLRRVFLQTTDITPQNFSADFVTDYGDGIKANYLMDLFSYPAGGTLQANVWEGAFPSDEKDFLDVTAHSGFSHMYIAYSMNTTRTNIGYPANATINMSVKTSWVATYPGGVSEGRNHVFVIATGYDGSGTHIGTVLPAHYLFSSGGYDYFAANIPPDLQYLSKFALSILSGSGNVFQFISIGITEHSGGSQSSSDSDTGPGPSGGKGIGQGLSSQQNQPPLNQPPVNPAAPTTNSVELYINDMGVVTQTTILGSADQLASLTIGQGVTAVDASGAPLSSITVETLFADQISQMPSPGTLAYAGMAYNFQPDGASFSPEATITFSVPNAQWGQQYTVREFDGKTGMWVDLPTTYHPESGTISASVSSFCCIALFSSATSPRATATVTKSMAAPPEAIPTPASSSPVGIFYNMVVFIANLAIRNLYLVLIVIAILAAFYLKGRRGRLDKIRYNR